MPVRFPFTIPSLVALSLMSPACGASPAQEEATQPIPPRYEIAIGGKEGFIDRAGEVVIPARYDGVRSFHEGLAAVEIGALREDGVYDHSISTWGFVDLEGKMVIAPTFEYVGDFHEGLASARVDGKDGFIDRKGELVLPAIWSGRVGHFSEGLAYVELSRDKIGYLNTKGELAFVLEGVDVGDPGHFSDGLVRSVSSEDEVRFFDSSGELKLALGDVFARDFHDGLAVARKDGGWGFLDQTGKFVIPPTFGRTYPFRDGLAAVRTKEEGAFYIDRSGKTVVPANGYDDHGPFSEGLAHARDMSTGLYGYIDRNGEWAIAAKWDDPRTRASTFRGGLAAVGVKWKDKRGNTRRHRLFLDRSGEVVYDPRK